MIKQIITNTNDYKKKYNKDLRKTKGQFFTSQVSAMFMAKSAAMYSDQLRIIEPGAGNGLLSAALIKYCMEQKLCYRFYILFIENDPEILPLLNETVSLIQEYVKDNQGSIKINIMDDNFLLKDITETFDIAICNPPYRKINKNSPESIKMKRYVYGQPNLYSLFMVKSTELLKENGRFVFITPRSWTSGDYYKLAREFLIQSLNFTAFLVYIFENNEINTVPLFRSANITNEGFLYPVSIGKPQYISCKANKLLIPNNNTVLVRRLSAKEEFRRLQSCVYISHHETDHISIENHVNYLVRKDGKPLSEEEVYWINDILMSDKYDTYFRVINGNTQVNAGELNKLPLERKNDEAKDRNICIPMFK